MNKKNLSINDWKSEFKLFISDSSIWSRAVISLYIMYIEQNWLDYFVCIFNNILNAICMVFRGIQFCFGFKLVIHCNITTQVSFH